MALTPLNHQTFRPLLPAPLAVLLMHERNYPLEGAVWPTTAVQAIHWSRNLFTGLLARNPFGAIESLLAVYRWVDQHLVFRKWMRDLEAQPDSSFQLSAPVEWPSEVEKAFPTRVVPHPWLLANLHWSVYEKDVTPELYVLLAYAHGMPIRIMAEASVMEEDLILQMMVAGVGHFCSDPNRMLWLLNINWDVMVFPSGFTPEEQFRIKANPFELSAELAQAVLSDSRCFRLACGGGGGMLNIYTLKNFLLNYVQAPDLTKKDQERIVKATLKLERLGLTR